MRKLDFLGDEDVACFIQWLADVISGKEVLRFKHVGGNYCFLDDALAKYSWPFKKVEFKHPVSGEKFFLAAGSCFAENQDRLEEFSRNLRNCLDGGSDWNDLSGHMEAVMRWGGVYTRTKNGGGNAGWLDGFSGQPERLIDYLKRACNVLSRDNEDDLRSMPELRSNSGLTKVYSLCLDNFVIYDSRVSGALAWLIKKWADGKYRKVPEELEVSCMRGRGNLIRSPDEEVFPYFVPSGLPSNHHRHAQWNLRASWLIESAIHLSGSGRTSREVEAALFMMGYDLSEAI